MINLGRIAAEPSIVAWGERQRRAAVDRVTQAAEGEDTLVAARGLRCWTEFLDHLATARKKYDARK